MATKFNGEIFHRHNSERLALLHGAVGIENDDSRPLSAPLSRPLASKPAATARRSGSAGRIARAVVQGPADSVRQKDKLVPLPESVSPASSPRHNTFSSFAEAAFPSSPDALSLHISEQSSGVNDGLIISSVGVVCVCDAFDLVLADQQFRSQHSQYTLKTEEEVLHAQYRQGPPPGSDVFVFAYGVVVLWGVGDVDTERIMQSVKGTCRGKPLPARQVEKDKFQVHFTRKERPHILNDIITINRHLMNDDQVKLAISHALAQSTKLAVYEERVSSLIESTKHLPEQLAEMGHVKIDRQQLAQVIGEVYLQRSHVNLLSSVMDTPDFFWEVPDVLQEVYKALAQYLELEDRIELINSRFTILGEMLDLLRDHQAIHHGHRLEWIVIWLIVLEVVIGCAQIAEMFGLL